MIPLNFIDTVMPKFKMLIFSYFPGRHYIVQQVATIYQWCDSSSNTELVFSLPLFPIKRPQLKNAKKMRKALMAVRNFYIVSFLFNGWTRTIALCCFKLYSTYKAQKIQLICFTSELRIGAFVPLCNATPNLKIFIPW